MVWAVQARDVAEVMGALEAVAGPPAAGDRRAVVADQPVVAVRPLVVADQPVVAVRPVVGGPRTGAPETPGVPGRRLEESGVDVVAVGRPPGPTGRGRAAGSG